MRYFLFTYYYILNDCQEGFGHLRVACEKFPSNKKLKDYASKNSGAGVARIAITGWNEFQNQEDYLNFIGDE